MDREAAKKSSIFLLLLFLLFTFWLSLQPQTADAATIGRPMNNDGLVGYWDFSIGKGGSTVYDRSGNGFDGTMTNMDINTAWVNGKIGQGMEFDGSDDFVDLSDLLSNSAGAVSLWVKQPSSLAGGCDGGLCFAFGTSINTSSRVYLGTDSSRNLYARLAGSNAFGSSYSLTANVWYHLVLTWNGTSGSVYANGEWVETQTGLSWAGDPTNVNIGSYNLGTNAHFIGLIDEVRAYNRALSANEVKRLYNMTGPKLGVTPTVVGDGLVGHWTFDGSDMIGGVLDRSGNGNHGTLKNFTSTTTVLGTIGQALSFSTATSGSPRQHVLASGPLSPPVTGTVAGWFTYSGSSAGILGRFTCGNVANRNGFHLRVTGGVLRGEVLGNGVTNTINSPSTITTNDWHFGALSFDGSLLSLYVDGSMVATTSQTMTNFDNCNNSTQAFIGGNMHVGGGVYANLNGSLDDVRIYNRALSADEISRIYNATRPSSQNVSRSPGSLSNGLVGHWSFDGDLSSAITDHSGSGNDGYVVGAATSSMTTIGKLGQALQFDGGDDYISIGDVDIIDGASQASVCAWIKYDPSSVTQDSSVAAKWSSSNQGWLLWVDDVAAISGRTDTVTFSVDTNPGGGSATGRVEGSVGLVSSNTWDFYCGTFRGNTFLRLYKNGILDQENTTSIVSTVRSNSNFLRIGDSSDASLIKNFNGSIDNVRIYNRALSADEIERLYRLGQ